MIPSEAQAASMRRVAEAGTPAYVYFLDELISRTRLLDQALGGAFSLSYAVKANPNEAVLRSLEGELGWLDVSSGGEVARALEVGWPADHISFSGPAKTRAELQHAVAHGVHVVAESTEELDALDACGRPDTPVLLRFNPVRVPKGFGGRLSGRPSPFGIDEELLEPVVRSLAAGRWPHLELVGLHVYSATNSLSPEAIGENASIMAGLFETAAAAYGAPLRHLVFGSGMGIPYQPDTAPLDLTATARLLRQVAERLAPHPLLGDAQCVLELGRWLVGPAGYLLTTVRRVKHSRGVEIGICDAGMHHHLAACGLMGMVIHRNYPMWNLTRAGDAPVQLTGPLCTTIDTLARGAPLGPLSPGDLIAIGASGAYGRTASPEGFISHPPPREVAILGDRHEECGSVVQGAPPRGPTT